MRWIELHSLRKRVLSAILDEGSDLLPVVSVNQSATAEVMKIAGTSWPEAHRDPNKMANLAVAAQNSLGFENVRMPFDQTVEAEALGASIRYGGELDFPEVSSVPYTDASQLKVAGDIMLRGRIGVVLNAISIARLDSRCEAPIVSGIVGPFSVVAQTFGLERCLKWTVRSPDSVARAMEEILPFLVSYANEQVKRGSDIISIEDMASSPDMLNPKFFKDIASKYLGELIDSIDAPVILHICGNATKIIEKMVELAPNAIHLDAETDLSVARKVSRGKVKLAGNLSPVTTLLRGNENDVKQAVIKAVQGGICIVSPGCSLSPMTPSANIRAMIQAAKELESGKGSSLAGIGTSLEDVFVNYEVEKSRSSVKPPAQPVEKVREPVLAELANAVLRGDADEVRRQTKKAMERFEPSYIIENGLTPGITAVSRMWDTGEYFLPEVIVASDALQIGVKLCEEAMNKAYERKGKVITFVPEGDIHDIGKNIVVSFLRAAGFEVVDLGKNVTDDRVVEAVMKEKPLLVCGSALMTTTMSAFPRIAAKLVQSGAKVPLAVGGGAVTQEFAESFALGVYGERPNDAIVAAELAKVGTDWQSIRKKLMGRTSGSVADVIH